MHATVFVPAFTIRQGTTCIGRSRGSGTSGRFQVFSYFRDSMGALGLESSMSEEGERRDSTLHEFVAQVGMPSRGNTHLTNRK